MNNSRSTVDVLMATYNHEDYIEKAVLSVLNQKTNFPFRLIVSDDCSTDNTSTILKELQSKFDNNLVVYYQNTNLGLKGDKSNSVFLYDCVESDYIAILDGDDYWTDENKLQKQVDFLNSNQSYSYCVHGVLEDKNGTLKESDINSFNSASISTFEQGIQKKIGATLSIVARVYPTYYSHFKKLITINAPGDYSLYTYLLLHGPGYVFSENMGVYRIHNLGISNEFNSLDFINGRIHLAQEMLHLPVIRKKNNIYVKSFLSRCLVIRSGENLLLKNTNWALRDLFMAFYYWSMSFWISFVIFKKDFAWKRIAIAWVGKFIRAVKHRF